MTAVLLLVLAAGANVGIAWACALWMPLGPVRVALWHPDDSEDQYERSGFGTTYRVSTQSKQSLGFEVRPRPLIRYTCHAGWPLAALSNEVTQFPKGPNRQLAFHELEVRIVPFTPVWPGFTLNMLVYCAVALVVLLPRRIIRVWRHRHGLCVRCGYDLAGNVTGTCPECGSPASAVATAPSTIAVAGPPAASRAP